MIGELDAWSARCTSVLAELDAEIALVRSEAAKRALREQRAEKQVKTMMESGSGDGKGGGKGTRGKAVKDEDFYDDEMDVDGNEGVGKKGGLGSMMGKLRSGGGR